MADSIEAMGILQNLIGQGGQPDPALSAGKVVTRGRAFWCCAVCSIRKPRLFR